MFHFWAKRGFNLDTFHNIYFEIKLKLDYEGYLIISTP